MSYNPVISAISIVGPTPILGGSVFVPPLTSIPGVTIWTYDSITDSSSQYLSVGYFTYVGLKGVRVNDIIIVKDRTSGSTTVNQVYEIDGEQNASIVPLSGGGGGGGIDALIGDVSAAGSGVVTATLASVATPGSFTNANITIDAKGRVLTAANGSSGGYVLPVANSTTLGGVKGGGANITIASDGTISASGGGGGSGITALTGDVSASGTGSVAATVLGVGNVTTGILPVANGGNGWFTGAPSTTNYEPAVKLTALASRAAWQASRKGASPFISSMSNTTPLLAVGFTKMVSGYAGNCCNVIRASDGANLDIPFLADGIVDTNLMIIFAGASSVAMHTFYDQSGNSNDLVQSTTANQPGIDVSVLHNGCPSLIMSNTNFLVIPNGVALTSTKNASVWTAVGIFSNQLQTQPFQLGTTYGLILTPVSAYSVQPLIFDGGNSMGTMQALPNVNGSVIGLDSSSTAITFFRNNYSVAIAAATGTTTATGGSFPSSAAGTAQSEQFALVVFNASLSAADASIMQYGISQSYSFVVAPTANIAIVGDSRTVGVVPNWWNYAKALFPYISNEVSIYNFGVGGQTMQTEIGETSSNVIPTFKAGIPNIAIMAGGVNDFNINNATAVQVEGYLTSWASLVHAAGGIAGAMTMFPLRGSSSSAVQQLLYNAWLKQNSGSGKVVDFLVDVTLEPSFLPSWSTNDSPDNLHPSIQCYKKVGPIMAQAITNQLYGQVP